MIHRDEESKQYAEWLSGLKSKVRHSQLKAAASVNAELLRLYWEMGGQILELERKAKWGDGFLAQLSADLKAEFPEMKGFSERNLGYMRRWVRLYSPGFPQQPVAEIGEAPSGDGIASVIDAISIPQQPVAEFDSKSFFGIPWGHHLLIMTKTKDDPAAAWFYIRQAAEHGWSRSVLSLQIESRLHERQGRALTNFANTLPATQSDLAQELLKSPYSFDFLTLGPSVRELDLERALVKHVSRFLLELGRGFAYVGRQKNLKVEGDDYFPDLIFFNTQIRRYVVVELKVGDFQPEFVGKLGFYCQAVNEQMKEPGYEPTVGLLLCKTPNKTAIRYSLSGSTQPIGVADYEIASALPQELEGELPTVEELEAEMRKMEEEIGGKD